MSFEEIKTYTPKPEDEFFVDANIWYWVTYVSSKQMCIPNAPKKYQVDCYPDFIQRILDAGAKLYVTPFILAELASVIEKTEFEIYKQWNQSGNTSRKGFRKDDKQRAAVLREIENAWEQVNTLASCIEVSIDGDFVESSLTRLNESKLDGYDSFHVCAVLRHGLSNLVTDDKDFRSVKELKVFTTYE